MDLQKSIANLPTSAGIYHYYDQDNQLLYIGKAANLKRRVQSYFQRPQVPRIAELVRRIARLRVTQTDSVIEALILEANEIRAKQPPFNVRQKDDKSFVTIIITKEDFPRVLISRPTQSVNAPILEEFGPYPSADSARIALTIIRKIFPFRTKCTVATTPNSRGCLDYQIGLCPGSCSGNISKKEYSLCLKKVTLFLRGKKHILIRQLDRSMRLAAQRHQYEQAAQLRNQLTALNHIQDVALIRQSRAEQTRTNTDLPQRIEGYDISNILNDYAVGSMVVVTDGQIDTGAYRKFRIKTVEHQNDVAMMGEVIFRRLRHREWPLPDLLVIDGGKGHLRQVARMVDRSRLTIPIIAAAKGPDRKNLDLYPSDNRPFPLTSELTRRIRLARDEAHRFAIRYHRSRRDKGFLD